MVDGDGFGRTVDGLQRVHQSGARRGLPRRASHRRQAVGGGRGGQRFDSKLRRGDGGKHLAAEGGLRKSITMGLAKVDDASKHVDAVAVELFHGGYLLKVC